MARPVTITSGQLSASAATLLAGEDAPASNRIDVLLQNTSEVVQTVTLTFRVASDGTARRLWRIELQQNEQALVGALPITPGDALIAVATSASAVDYTVFASSGGGMRLEVLSANGTNKGVATLRQILLGMQVLTDDELPDPGE